MRINLDISFEEVELYLEGLKNTIIVIAQKLNVNNLRESIIKLEKVSGEIEKIERAINKGGVLHKEYNIKKSILGANIYILEEKNYEVRT